MKFIFNIVVAWSVLAWPPAPRGRPPRSADATTAATRSGWWRCIDYVGGGLRAGGQGRRGGRSRRVRGADPLRGGRARAMAHDAWSASARSPLLRQARPSSRRWWRPVHAPTPRRCGGVPRGREDQAVVRFGLRTMPRERPSLRSAGAHPLRPEPARSATARQRRRRHRTRAGPRSRGRPASATPGASRPLALPRLQRADLRRARHGHGVLRVALSRGALEPGLLRLPPGPRRPADRAARRPHPGRHGRALRRRDPRGAARRRHSRRRWPRSAGLRAEAPFQAPRRRPPAPAVVVEGIDRTRGLVRQALAPPPRRSGARRGPPRARRLSRWASSRWSRGCARATPADGGGGGGLPRPARRDRAGATRGAVQARGQALDARCWPASTRAAARPCPFAGRLPDLLPRGRRGRAAGGRAAGRACAGWAGPTPRASSTPAGWPRCPPALLTWWLLERADRPGRPAPRADGGG